MGIMGMRAEGVPVSLAVSAGLISMYFCCCDPYKKEIQPQAGGLSCEGDQLRE